MSNRRKFIRHLGGTAALLTTGSFAAFESAARTEILKAPKRISANDKIQIAGIGMGIQGYNDVNSALKVPGVEIVAVADLYDGRLKRAKEVYGDHLFTTRNYLEVLDRPEVDAVIIGTSDNWHSRIAIDAMKKGKAVYVEKPMVHLIEQGWDVINTQRSTKKALQVGSQGTSSLGYAKAKELFKQGVIGEINSVVSVNNRQSPLGAWEYTIPLDASPETVDWDRYVATLNKKTSFDEKKFFWWRNYREFGTGMAGDLYVHMLSSLHFITGAKGPNKIYSIGDLTYWKDGRNVPDVMNAVMQYPKSNEHAPFQVSLQVNFVSGEGDSGFTKITGSEGVMFVGGERVTVKRRKMPKAPSIGGWDSLFTFPNEMQDKLKAEHAKKYKEADTKPQVLDDITYAAPNEFDEHVAHFANFFDSVREGKPVVQDAVFGFRAAAPCLACNDSYFQNKVINWDPEKMKLV
jgi:predicted dehydrogenase